VELAEIRDLDVILEALIDLRADWMSANTQ